MLPYIAAHEQLLCAFHLHEHKMESTKYVKWSKVVSFMYVS